MGKKDIILFVSIFCVLALIVGGTYAYWQWESGENTQVLFNTPKDIDDYIYYDGGDSHFVGNFQPSDSHCEGKANSLEFYILDDAPAQITEKKENGSGILTATLKMDINKIDDEISSSNYVKWAVTSGDESDCSSMPLSNGTFNGKASGNQITLLSNREIFLNSECSDTKFCKYTVWVWVDNAGGALLNDLSGKTIDVNVWTQIDMGSAD